jgi:hypothetical protein
MNAYVYLIRRDKKDLKIITILQGSCPTKKLDKIQELNLSKDLESQIESIVRDHKMNWEAWIENASSIQDLIDNLSARGLRRIPISIKPVLKMKHNLETKSTIDSLTAKRMKINPSSSSSNDS